MRRQVLAASALSLLAAGIAQADDRPVTPEERAKLVAAMQTEGCSGGGMEFDEGLYEVDDAKCSDGREYDLKFDASFKLVDKDRDD